MTEEELSNYTISSKKEIREKMNMDIKNFLNSGGQIQKLESYNETINDIKKKYIAEDLDWRVKKFDGGLI